MKRNFGLIASAIFVIINFIKCWYSDLLFNALFLLYPLINIFLFIFLMNIIKKIKKEKLFEKSLVIILLLFSISLSIFFPFREVKAKFELNRYEEGRLQIISKIISKEIEPYDDFGNIKLKGKNRKYSTGGEITIRKNDEGGQIISFWIFRGLLSGSVELIYSTGEESMIKKGYDNNIRTLKKLKNNWYYVETYY